MKIRQISIVLAVLVIIGAVIASRFLGSKEEEKPEAKPKALPKVNTITIKNSNIQAPIIVTGKLVAPDKVELFAEVSGVLLKSSQAFKEGNAFARGNLMISIDDEEARLNMLSQKSALLNAITRMMPDMKLDYPEAYPDWQQYLDKFDVESNLKPLPEVNQDKVRYYVIANNIYNQYYAIKSQEARLRKYRIYAPFSGVVSEANINPGTLVRVGQKLGEFINAYNYELQAAVSVGDLEFMKVGDQVKLTSDNISGEWLGVIKRISNRIDPSTQSVNVFIGVGGKKLKEGMFLSGTIKADEVSQAVSISRNLLNDDNQVFIVENKRLKLQEVKPVRYTGNEVVVKGLKNQTQLVNESSKEFFEGMEVEAN